MVSKLKIEEMIRDLESKTYKIGSSDSLIADEERYTFLKSYIDNKICDEEFMNQIGEIMSCPPDQYGEYCSGIRPTPKTCKECWKIYLTSSN